MKAIGRTIFNILTAIFAVIGALTLVVALVFGSLIIGFDQAGKQPLTWPAPTRECPADGARPLSDSELLNVAVARWNADAEREGDTYRRKYVGGPALPAASVVERLNVVPPPDERYVVADLETNRVLEMRSILAHKGVRQYVQVTLALAPPVNPDLKVQAKTASRIYLMDLCGAALP